MIYYLGEINQARKIDNQLYDILKAQGLAVTLSNNQPLPNFIKIANDQVQVYTNDVLNIGKYAIKYQGCYNYKRASFFQGVDIRKNTPPTL